MTGRYFLEDDGDMEASLRRQTELEKAAADEQPPEPPEPPSEPADEEPEEVAPEPDDVDG